MKTEKKKCGVWVCGENEGPSPGLHGQQQLEELALHGRARVEEVLHPALLVHEGIAEVELGGGLFLAQRGQLVVPPDDFVL